MSVGNKDIWMDCFQSRPAAGALCLSWPSMLRAALRLVMLQPFTKDLPDPL